MENHHNSNEATWKQGAPAGLTLEPTPLPITGTPATANIASKYAQYAQYEPWTLENHHNSNEATWTQGAPAGLTLEPTPLPITGTPKTANIGSKYAQYDHWTIENHLNSNEATWKQGAPAGFTFEPTPLPI